MVMQIKLVVVVIPNSGPKWARLHPFSDQNGAKTLPFGADHTYIAYVGEYPCPRVTHLSGSPFCDGRDNTPLTRDKPDKRDLTGQCQMNKFILASGAEGYK